MRFLVTSLLSRIGIGAGVILAATAIGFGIYWLWRKAPRVLLAIVLLLIVAGLVWLFEFFLPGRYPTIDPALPIFRPRVWTWMLAFTLLALGTAIALVRAWWRWRRYRPADVSSGVFPDIDAAWESIVLAFDQARIDPTAQRFILILAPDEAEAASLVRSAGLQLYAESPPSGGPIHAYATAEAVLLSVAGASNFGHQSGGGSERLTHLCRLLRDLNPECPVARGVIVLFPTSWADHAEAPSRAAAVREDLRTIGNELKVRPPVFALLGRMEEIDGLPEFLARMPEATRGARCGFAIPGSVTYSSEMIGRGLIWLSGWFDTWCLNLIAADLLDTRSNGRLFLLTDAVRRRRRRWRNIMEAAFSTHREAQTVPLRGCYGVAYGDRPDRQAFASGLIRGARSRIVADSITTDWAEEAFDDDQTYRRAALAVGVVGGLLSLLAWAYILGNHNPFWWLAFLAVLVAWIVVIVRMTLR